MNDLSKPKPQSKRRRPKGGPKDQASLDLALIGNCSFAGLLNRQARIVWSCVPRFDGDPVFCDLLAGGADREAGFFEIELQGLARAEQSYRRNSAVVDTRLYDGNGGAIEITDFAPRFKLFGRPFRPTMLVRQIRPISGTPCIRIRLRPAHGYGAGQPSTTRGSNHIRYVMPDLTLRLTTDAPVAYVLEEVPFVLEWPLTLILGPDESLTQPVAETGREFCEKTDEYWREWCRYLSLPFEWQEAVIRAAITLKLSNFEESGAMIAAMTTSIPEAPDSGRNWDYRYCWLRDSYFMVHALNRLGVTRTMEGFLGYIINIVAGAPDGYLQPMYGITLENKLPEREVETLPGYRGMGPVRVGNDAYTQVQNDGYGNVVLACTQSFFDHRVTRMGDANLFRLLERLGEQAVARWDQPDSGLWELRKRQTVHTFSSVMCWAACDRLARIAAQLRLDDRRSYWSAHAARVRDGILTQAWNSKLDSLTSSFGGKDVDASLLQLPELGFIAPDDPRFTGTFALIEKELRRSDYIFRYAAPDDHGTPETAFNICTFWYIDALALMGRIDEARELFENMLGRRNHLGLLSEDLDPHNNELWGNFPQTYSMVGLINSAMRLSKPWEEAL
ncbi:MAG: glycoside hydrolase family 15 protein [Alphaproteobacteria bacterium]|nr:glycoside hydrolase family 15 protein [Alphaproteobacteria bacterium]